MPLRFRWLFTVLLSLSAPAAGQVVVEGVEPGTAAAKAGLADGDRLAGFRRETAPPAKSAGASGRFATWLDLEAALVEEAPRGRFRLDTVRGGVRRRVVLPQGDWGLDARPEMTPELLDAVRAERTRAGSATEFRRPSLPDGADPAAACWLVTRMAADFAGRRLAEPARAAFAEARPCVERLGGRPALVRLLVAEGMALRGAEDYARAASVLREAAAAASSAAPRSLLAAHAWHQLGLTERFRGELDPARAAFERARAIREEAAPKSLALGYTYNNLGIVALLRSELDTARTFCRRALALMRSADPGGSGEGDVLNNLALIARDRGDYATADRHLSRATAIRKALGPESASYGYSLVNLAALASDRGDHARSDGLLEEALAIFEKTAPGGLTSAHILNNLGVNSRERGDLQAAEELLRRALAIREKLAPESLEVASTLSNLAGVLEMEGHLPEAIAMNERAFAIRQKRAPEGIEASWSLEALGHVARAQGDLGKARDYFRQALAMREKAGPGVAFAGALQNLGEVLRDLGELDRAQALLKRALELRSRFAPASLLEAQSAHALGILARKRRDLPKARAYFDTGLDAMDAQLGRIGGSDEGHAGFGASRDEMFKDQIGLLEEMGRPDEAFLYRERARARALLAMMAGRDVDLTEELPPALRGRAQRLDADVRRLEGELAKAGADRARQEALLGQLRALREEQGRLDARAASSSPRMAALRVPRPLDAAAARATLEPGELLLAYSVLPTRTLLFVLPAPGGADGLSVLSLPAGRDALASEVGMFRSLVLAGRERTGDDPALEAQGRRLWDLLVAPAAGAVARARRLLLSPDGPLEVLPFAALRTPSGRWLAEELPLHFALSATLHAELARRRRSGASTAVIFGAASVPMASDSGSGPPLVRYRRGLPPLPEAREESEAVAALLGRGARLFSGSEATEERARSAGAHARILHFAGHALLDRQHPLESGLAFARPPAPGGEDGFLQAWEVVRSVRLEADLVTLSGCETALGAQGGGEGLLGLTRAFQFAGARSVLASLWSVSDRTTTRLMEAFYRSLLAGMPRDEALQAAELELLRGGFAHPFHWAAFVLSGEPR